MGADATAYYIQDSADTDSALSISTTRVGIGTANPAHELDINSTGVTTLNLESTANYNTPPSVMINATLEYNSSDASTDMGRIVWAKNNATDDNTGAYLALYNKPAGGSIEEAMRIDPDGNVGIGSANPHSPITISTTLDAADNADQDKFALMIRNHADDTNEEIGIGFRISSNQNADNAPGGAMTFERTSSNSVGNLHFKTAPSSEVLTTRMTIDKDGNVGIGTANPGTELDIYGNTGAKPQLGYFTGASDDPQLRMANGKSTRPSYGFINDIDTGIYYGGPGIIRFTTASSDTVTMNNGNVQFNAYGAGTLSTDSSGNITASDERLKDKTRTLESGLDLVQQLSPTFFKWKEDSGLDQVIVQESIASVEAVEAQDAVYETVVTTEAQEEVAWDVELPTVDNTKDEIKSFMDEYSLEYNSGDTKQDLLDKIPSVKQEAIEEVTEEQLVSEAVEAVEGVEGQDEIKEYQGTEHLGFIAQEVQAVIPEASHSPRDPSRPLNYDDRGLIAVLVKAVQELSAKVEALENK